MHWKRGFPWRGWPGSPGMRPRHQAWHSSGNGCVMPLVTGFSFRCCEEQELDPMPFPAWDVIPLMPNGGVIPLHSHRRANAEIPGMMNQHLQPIRSNCLLTTMRQLRKKKFKNGHSNKKEILSHLSSSWRGNTSPKPLALRVTQLLVIPE